MDQAMTELILKIQITDVDEAIQEELDKNCRQHTDTYLSLVEVRGHLQENLMCFEDRRLASQTDLDERAERTIVAGHLEEERRAAEDREAACRLAGTTAPQADRERVERNIEEAASALRAAEDHANLTETDFDGNPVSESPDTDDSGYCSVATASSSDVKGKGVAHHEVRCCACQDFKQPADTVELSCDAEHIYCHECLVEQFESSTIDTELFPPRCCRQTIPLERVKSFFPQDLITRLEEKAVELSTPNPTYCSQKRCSRFIAPENIIGNVANCAACSALTCTSCKAPSHDGLCPEDPNVQALLSAARENGWQECKTSAAVELSSATFAARDGRPAPALNGSKNVCTNKAISKPPVTSRGMWLHEELMSKTLSVTFGEIMIATTETGNVLHNLMATIPPARCVRDRQGILCRSSTNAINAPFAPVGDALGIAYAEMVIRHPDNTPCSRSSRKLSLSDDDPLSSSNPATRRPNGGHLRSYSVSSAFNFASNLFPLSSTAGVGYTAIGAPSTANLDPSSTLGGGSLEKTKSLNYLSGLSLVVGLIIGSGIFSSPSEVNVHAGSPGASLIVWAVAGVLAWTGAASYAELGSAIPLNGGAQVYLSKIFGELAGFLYAWCCVCVLKPGSAAIIAIIFGEYVVRAVIGADAVDASPWINKGVAIAGLTLVTLLNCVSTKVGMRAAQFFLFFKFVALVAVTVIGVLVAATGLSWNGKANEDWKTHGWFDGTSTSLSDWAVALYAGLWAYDGWDNVNYVAGEFSTPGRDIPRVIHTSLPLVILSYILANLAYFLVLPLSLTSTTTTVAVAFGQRTFGPLGAVLFALIVSGSCFGSLNATTFTAGRLTYAAGKEGYVPAPFGRLGIGPSSASIRLHDLPMSTNQKSFRTRLRHLIADDAVHLFHTPINALLLNSLFTAAYVAFGSFRTLITFYGVAGYTFYFLTVLGCIVLRLTEPHLERPYKAWLTTPVIFCCVSLFLLSRALFAEPKQTLIVVVFVLAGIPVWALTVRRKRRRRKKGDAGPGWRFWKRWGRAG